ncbi:MAG TPA: phytanoyl-CoA dioxygenase family protein [Polyangiaceae bacterium]|nr:phytanoyl-CoA dioxygenase family protein [Polyangiaceae bacterium]
MEGWDQDAHVRAIEHAGYTIIRDFLSPATLAEVRRVLAFYLGRHGGRNNFEGYETERVYTLVARGRIFWDIALDPRVLALCGRFLLPNFLLTASQAIEIRPGETPQPFHTDDSFYTVPRPRPMISLSTIVAVDAFTAENGGTEVVPASHVWDDARIEPFIGEITAESPTRQEPIAALARPVEMPAGACVVFAGTLVHRGGANRSAAPRLAFSNQYCQPWARQQENFTLSVPVEVAREMPPALQSLLGFSIHPPFMGQLTASHPAKALEPGYENRVVAQAAAAGARLPE